jgi:hypothetical protein
MVYRLPPHLKVNNVSHFFFLAKLTRGSLIKALMYKGGERILTFWKGRDNFKVGIEKETEDGRWVNLSRR